MYTSSSLLQVFLRKKTTKKSQLQPSRSISLMTTDIGASSSSSPVSFSSHSWTYDVFFSFRGTDTRLTFTEQLNRRLIENGVRTFIDSDELRRGQSIPDSLNRAIEESKICVIVFSVNYADSRWCLEELVKILNCNSHQIVYPIFYKVEPADVRSSTGSFGKALEKHECRFKAEKDEIKRNSKMKMLETWKMALKKAGIRSGQHIPADGYEAEFLDKIVEEISRLVSKCFPLDVANYPTGIESRVKDVLKLLNVGQNNVQIVGIWGLGGIGKTTVAKAVYNSISHEFYGSCFLADVSKKASIQGGLVKLQNTLLSKILGGIPFDLKDADEGINMIKTRLSRKKILLILDDVDRSDQLDKLIGVSSDWLGLGSRIIITTRDKRCLVVCKDNHIYEVKELSHEQGLQLFNFYAFKRITTPTDSFVKLADDVVHYAKGIPLVLEVLGSDLCGKNSLDEWQDALDNYKRYPNKDIQETLRRSYDTLGESVKEVFLYIACFFKGQTKSCVIDVLEGCDLNPKHGIGVLREKALINIVEDDRVWMHDLVETMGKEVVRQESPHDPGKRSRLWLYDDIFRVLEGNQGTDKIKGILVTNDIPRDICLNSESFSKLKNLQIFLAYTEKFSGNEMDYLSSQLRVIYWNNCPLRSFPTDFNPRKLVMLHMNQALIFPLSKELKNLQYVKSIHLAGCEGLTRVPDLSGLRSLMDLNMSKCKNLVEVDESVGVLDNLVRLDLSNCIKLTMFQTRINLRSLEYLKLQSCPLERFPKIEGEMEFLKHLNLSESDIRKFPSSDTNLRRRSSSISLHVDLSKCKRLKEVLEFPQEIDYLNLRNCSSLARVSKLSRISEGDESKMMRWMDLSRCQKLCDNILTNSKTLSPLLKSSATSAPPPCQNKEKLSAVLSLFLSCRNSEFEVVFPSSAPVPKWFTSRMKFNRTKLAAHPYKCCACIEIPEDFSWENKGLAICAQSSKNCDSFYDLFSVHINEICVIRPYGNRESYPYAQTMYEDHIWLYYIPFPTLVKRLRESGLPPPQKCMVRFEFEVDHPLFDSKYASDAFQMQSCGVHVVMPTE